VKVTLQLPDTRLQVADGVKPPVPVATVKLTEPAGVDAPAPAVSATVAVQVEAWFTITAPHETLVEVERAVGVTAADVPELVA